MKRLEDPTDETVTYNLDEELGFFEYVKKQHPTVLA